MSSRLKRPDHGKNIYFIIGFNFVMQSIRTSHVAKNSSGYLTQQMHEDFWGEVESLGSEREIELVINSIKANMLFAQEYQKELWKSAKFSKASSQVVKTARLIELENSMESTFKKSLPYKKGSNQYNAAVTAYLKQIQAGSENAHNLLDSAVSGKPMTAAQGQIITVDDQLIETVLENVSTSFKRISSLLNKDWTESK